MAHPHALHSPALRAHSFLRQHRRAPGAPAPPRRLQAQRPRAVEELVGEPSTSASSSAEEAGGEVQLHRVPAGEEGQRAGKRVAVLQATKFAAVPVEEAGRPLAEYMTLPASQYSVLDAKRIERLDEETFVCYVGGLKFFSFEVEPVITVSVTVQERGPTVRLLGCKLRGSKSVEQANDKFTATMTNVVRWREAAEGGSSGGSSSSSDSGSAAGCREICSETSLRVELEVPGWFIIPVGAIEKTGCTVMETVLNTAVPRFLQQLATDYRLWAAGDADRHAAALESDALSFSDDSFSEDEY